MTFRGEFERPRPFHETPPASASAARRLLLISYIFAPTQASGSLRWQKLSRILAERGWYADVITLDPSCVAAPDSNRLRDLPDGTRVYGVPLRVPRVDRGIRAAYQSYRRIRPRYEAPSTADTLPASPAADRPSSIGRRDVRWSFHNSRGFIRAYSAWLEYARDGRWARDAARVALRLFERGVHYAVVTSGPPHMTHEAGRRVARETGLPFIMDMRDPWSLAERLEEDVASPVWL